MKIVILNDVYTGQEAHYNHPFVEYAGRELVKLLVESDLISPPKEKYLNEKQLISQFHYIELCNEIKIMTVFPFLAPNNEPEELFTGAKGGNKDLPKLKLGKFLDPKYNDYLEQMWKGLLEIKPNLIIALGPISSWAVVGNGSVTAIRGAFVKSVRGNFKVIATHHPRNLLTNYPLRSIIGMDFKKAKQDKNFPETRKVQRWALVNPTIEEIKDWLAVPATHYSCDIESGRALFTSVEIKHMIYDQDSILNHAISMIGFARSNSQALVIPFLIREGNELRAYWETREETEQVWRIVKEVLLGDKIKIFQNGIYDISMLLNYKMQFRNCKEDTMLLSHSLFSELPKGLGFLGSLYENCHPWKLDYQHSDDLEKDS